MDLWQDRLCNDRTNEWMNEWMEEEWTKSRFVLEKWPIKCSQETSLLLRHRNSHLATGPCLRPVEWSYHPRFSFFFNDHFTIIQTVWPSSKWFLLYAWIARLPHAGLPCLPRHSAFHLVTFIIFEQDCKSLSSTLRNYLYCPVTRFSFSPNIIRRFTLLC